MRSHHLLSSAIVAAACWMLANDSDRAVAADIEDAAVVRQVLKEHCVKCHGSDKPEGNVRLDDLSTDTRDQDAARLSLVHEQLRGGLMPPEGEARIAPDKLSIVLAWSARYANKQPRPLPNQGNLVPHELLFGKEAAPGDAGRARVWRLSPDAYRGFLKDVYRGRTDGLAQPFTVISDPGIKDFAELYSIDEPSTEVLVRNAEMIVAAQTAHVVKDGKLQGKNDTIGEFVKLMDPTVVPSRGALESAVQTQFRLALGRPADAAEVERFLALYEKCVTAEDRPGALKTMLQAVLLRAEAMYRSELGALSADGSGRSLLKPAELARALSLAVGDSRESGLMQAAEKGRLATKESIAAELRRVLDDPKIAKPRLLRFFREYFEYHRAPDVFKDKPTDKIKHVPTVLVSDTDRLVLHILEQDREVLRELLTTRLSFVNYNTKVDKSKPNRPLVGVPFEVIPPPDKNPKNKPEWLGGVDDVYGFSQWPDRQPVELPADRRLGILMQPSWLVAWSTNFDNDVVRRGRWIRERLLGGTVPDLPIGVVAQVPDEKHRTYRDRLQITRDAKCWKCHRQMDELGLPFENFDHYGRFRSSETVLDLEATRKNVDSKGRALGPVTREAPLVTSGTIAESGDSQLDGPVRDPRQLVLRLAGSERVRQVFVRHVFRYFLGRNESLADAQTLRQADRAYVESGGSFKALVISLLTSDSFLLRSAPTAPAATPPISESRP